MYSIPYVTMHILLTETDLTRFLSESKGSSYDNHWLENCKAKFLKILAAKPDSLKGNGEWNQLHVIILSPLFMYIFIFQLMSYWRKW